MKNLKVTRRLQLFNPGHKDELLKIFIQLRSYTDQASNSVNELEDLQDFPEAQLPAVDEEVDKAKENVNNDDRSSTGHVCSTCDITFSSVTDQRSHFRLDLHRYNLKKKLMGQVAVNEEEFDNLIDGLSSISGSDEEDESVSPDRQISRLMGKVQVTDLGQDETVTYKGRSNGRSNPKLIYATQDSTIFAVHKAVIPAEQRLDADLEVGEKLKNLASSPPLIAVIMISGGHFAAGVFQGTTEVLHKTFHSYTVRAKQGGAQGSRDGKSSTSHPKSAGASLRRYNEQTFKQHVQDLLSSWKDKLEACSLIFYRAVSFNQNVLFGVSNPILLKTDTRLRNIPFPTKRPTYSEVKRALGKLFTVEILEDKEDSLVPEVKPPKKEPQKSKRSQSRRAQELPDQPTPSPEPDEDLTFELKVSDETVDFRESLQEYDTKPVIEKTSKKPKKVVVEEVPVIRPEGDLGELLKLIESKKQEAAVELVNRLRSEVPDSWWNQELDSESSTLLHYAAMFDLKEILWLLMESGCDPSRKDKKGKVPYNYSSTKDGRKVFMRFVGQYPGKYDYSKSQIPGPLTDEIEKERAEKQKALNKAKREKEKMKKQVKKEKQAEEDERTRYLELSDREKRALAAERRILGQAAKTGESKPVLVRCFDCAGDITGKVPFEYNKNLFCSPKCLAAHRKKFPSPLSV